MLESIFSPINHLRLHVQLMYQRQKVIFPLRLHSER